MGRQVIQPTDSRQEHIYHIKQEQKQLDNATLTHNSVEPRSNMLMLFLRWEILQFTYKACNFVLMILFRMHMAALPRMTECLIDHPNYRSRNIERFGIHFSSDPKKRMTPVIRGQMLISLITSIIILEDNVCSLLEKQLVDNKRDRTCEMTNISIY